MIRLKKNRTQITECGTAAAGQRASPEIRITSLSDILCQRADIRSTVFAGQPRIRGVVIGEHLFFRVERQLSPQRHRIGFQVYSVLFQMLDRSLQRLLIVVETLDARQDL